MTAHSSSPFLRRALLADAVVSGVTGLVLVLGAGQLAALLGLHVLFLRAVGIGLIPFAAFLVYLARQRAPARAFVWLVVIGNALWAVDSIVLLFTGWVTPTALGTAFIVFQAVVVAVLAELQFIGARRTPVGLAAGTA